MPSPTNVEAATYAAYVAAARSGRIGATDEAVLFNCASGLKYPMPPVTRRIDVGTRALTL